MRIYLVRHGQTSWNIEGKLQGHADIELNELGQAQADGLREAFRGVEVDRILSSDLRRAVTTAQAIADVTGATIRQRTDLRERSFGQWEGADVREAARLTLEMSLEQGISTSFVRPPGGESFADVWERVGPFVEELAETDDRVAVVAHGGSCAAMLARLLEGTVETVRTFRFPNTSVTELERRADGHYTMLRYADATHLAKLLETSGSAHGGSR